MSSADTSGTVSRALLAAGTATYDCPDFETLSKVPQVLHIVVETLQRLGFSTVVSPPGYRVDLAAESLRTAVLKAAYGAPVVVVYYTGNAA